MKQYYRLRQWIAVSLLPFLSATLPAATGIVHYVQHAGPNWDQYTSSTDPQMQLFIRNNLWRITTYTPYFDYKLSWMPEAWVYLDSYAIYTNSSLATAHPEWILKDPNGNKLYIPWGCSNGTCPQYAGDISNPAFRSYQISQIQGYLAANTSTPYGYRGLWLDDVNLTFAVSDGNGNLVAPLDPSTGKSMTYTDWKRYFAEYVELIRNSLPRSVEILHNSVWFAGSQTDPSIRRQISAADFVNVERGFGDPGLTGGAGPFSLTTFMQYFDYVHSLGTATVVDDYYMLNQRYSVAGYFLVQNGSDCFGIQEQTPANWPAHLYSVNLGSAVNARHKWSNVWRRDFANGFVLLNEPGAATQTILLPQGMTDVDGNPVSVVTMSAKQGGVYLYAH